MTKLIPKMTKQERDQKIYDLFVKKGRPMVYIANRYGLTRQRVHQIIQRLEKLNAQHD